MALKSLRLGSESEEDEDEWRVLAWWEAEMVGVQISG